MSYQDDPNDFGENISNSTQNLTLQGIKEYFKKLFPRMSQSDIDNLALNLFNAHHTPPPSQDEIIPKGGRRSKRKSKSRKIFRQKRKSGRRK
jgi:hypothetical protein